MRSKTVSLIINQVESESFSSRQRCRFSPMKNDDENEKDFDLLSRSLHEGEMEKILIISVLFSC